MQDPSLIPAFLMNMAPGSAEELEREIIRALPSSVSVLS